MYLITLLLSIVPIQATLRVGRISNATWQLDPTVDISRYVNITGRTCEQCLCLMLMNELSGKIACQPAVFTCQLLYMNATALLGVDHASIVYLLAEIDQGLTTSDPPLATTFFPVCDPMCLNGGICVGTNTCQCPSAAWIGTYCQTPDRILWKFDNNFDDTYGTFSGIGINGPTFQSSGIDGSGTCLYLNGSAGQSVAISSPPFLNMVNTSFSVSAWVNANTLRNGSFFGDSDNAIFAQLDMNTASHSLHFIIRHYRAYLGFFTVDTQGNEILLPGQWYHLAFVYDYSILQQYVYVNGVLDATNSNQSPYQGSRGDVTIGIASVSSVGSSSWDGCLDRISFDARAKSSTEVLQDATQTVYYPFESNLLDQGSLGIDGVATQARYIPTGRVGQALDLTGTSSFVQARNLIYLGTDSHAYSLSIWIWPQVVMNGTVIHVASSDAGVNWSMPMLGFTADGRIAAQSCSSIGSVSLIGPTVEIGRWTHVAVTYTPGARFQLWVNGTEVNSSITNFSFRSAGVPVTATLGLSPSTAGPCTSSAIVMDEYSGYIDEFRLYSRALSSTDVQNLANP